MKYKVICILLVAFMLVGCDSVAKEINYKDSPLTIEDVQEQKIFDILMSHETGEIPLYKVFMKHQGGFLLGFSYELNETQFELVLHESNLPNYINRSEYVFIRLDSIIVDTTLTQPMLKLHDEPTISSTWTFHDGYYFKATLYLTDASEIGSTPFNKGEFGTDMNTDLTNDDVN